MDFYSKDYMHGDISFITAEQEYYKMDKGKMKLKYFGFCSFQSD
jgi:hypothetical protein